MQSIYGNNITSSYINHLNTALKKGGFNTHISHAHFFAQSKKEVGSNFKLSENPKYQVHTVLQTFSSKRSLKDFFKQSFWDDKKYLDYFHYKVYEKLDTAEEASKKYKGSYEKTYIWKPDPKQKIKIPTSFPSFKDGDYKKKSFSVEEQNTRNKKLFSYIYANKFENGEPSTEDGWKYRGRGLMHLTWRENYRRASSASGNKLGYTVNWQTNYQHVSDRPKDAVYSSVAYFLFKLNGEKFKKLYKKNNAKEISILVNGGLNGWPDRGNYFEELKKGLFKCNENE